MTGRHLAVAATTLTVALTTTTNTHATTTAATTSAYPKLTKTDMRRHAEHLAGAWCGSKNRLVGVHGEIPRSGRDRAGHDIFDGDKAMRIRGCTGSGVDRSTLKWKRGKGGYRRGTLEVYASWTTHIPVHRSTTCGRFAIVKTLRSGALHARLSRKTFDCWYGRIINEEPLRVDYFERFRGGNFN